MKKLASVLSWLITLLIPLGLLGLGVRVLLTPAFPQFEYRLPNFPPDDYGFSTADRLRWGTYGINYLLNNASASYLGDLKFPDGKPLFDSREVSHMHDVKLVTQMLLRDWYIILAIIALMALWAWRGRWWSTFLDRLRRGGQLTLFLAILAAAVGTVGASGSGDLFWQFFADFHGLFFAGNSWLFSFSDTLIRLYPLNFWQDAVLYIGLLTAVGAAALAFGIRREAMETQA